MLTPFVQINCRWYIIVNWRPGMKAGRKLELRPLSRHESSWLEPELANVIEDVWARLFPNDEAIKNGAEPPDNE